MAFIDTPNGLKAFISFSADGQPCGVTLWAFTPDPTDPLQRTGLANRIEAWLTGFLKFNLSAQTTMDAVEVTDQSSVTGSVTHVPISPPITGTIASNVLPLNTAFCVTLQTSARGRSGRGRTFVPGLPVQSQFDSQDWTGGATASMQDAFLGLLTTLNVSGQFVAVASHFNNKAPRPHGTLTPVQTVRANFRIASQRRRVRR